MVPPDVSQPAARWRLPLVLAGPTASGKSALAVGLAERTNGVVVCGDSRQVYARMRIGSAGPDDDELARAPHRGYGVVDPLDVFDAARFVAACDAHVDEALAEGRLPIVVGGSGLYLRSWRFGLDDLPGRDPVVRARLEEERLRLGTQALHARLALLDEEAARAIQPGDPVRVVRALEILEVTGEKPSALRRSHGRGDAPGAVRREGVFVLLEPTTAWLSPRIDERARRMFEAGLVEEALALRAHTGPGHRLLSTMGYEEALMLADGALDRDEAVRRAAARQRAYAKRQRTWFRGEPWWTRVDPSSGDVFEHLVRTVFQCAVGPGNQGPCAPSSSPS